jgi:polyisoprenoid-binding protein YceI
MKTALLLLLLTFVAPTAKRKLMADKTASSVTYQMKHPLHKWDAMSREVSSAITYDEDTKQIDNVAVSIPVRSFDSRNGNRDSHALEVLDAIKYPNVTFVSDNVKATPDGKLTISGKLTFHNVTKPAVIQAVRTDEAGRLTVKGAFDVSLTEHQVERPSLMTMKTEDTMKMAFTVVFRL